ncbi:hypothetical protein PIB30_032833 [Stylosanthes scabra]|uniref:C2 domain-containing protein n=1 Tax=Stylosanthes scabra TaxID=79078 RepID=A0ABU6Z989_9FABA|nr:hypothetical protein [Stylosanthes scabra]
MVPVEDFTPTGATVPSEEEREASLEGGERARGVGGVPYRRRPIPPPQLQRFKLCRRLCRQGSNPEWNETFVFNMSDGVKDIQLKIMDQDIRSCDDFVGEVTKHPTLPPHPYTVVKNGHYCGEIKLGLKFMQKGRHDRGMAEENFGGWKNSAAPQKPPSKWKVSEREKEDAEEVKVWTVTVEDSTDVIASCHRRRRSFNRPCQRLETPLPPRRRHLQAPDPPLPSLVNMKNDNTLGH